MKSGLAGIEGLSGLGELSGSMKEMINQNKKLVDRILEKEKLNGLGKINKGEEKLSFMQVVEQYNQGISTDEIKAWIYYKRKQSIPMKGWDKKYNVSDADLPKLVKAGVMFDHDGEYLPYPIFTYGNMYERKRILIENTDRIIGKYGQTVFDNHLKAIESAMPKKISIKHEDPKERPVILVVSKLARDPELFTIKTVRAEYLDTEKAEQLTKVNGKVNIKKQGKTQKYRPVNLNFDGENEYTLRDVFVKWMYTIPHSEFKKSNAIDIVEYYVYNRALRDDKLTNDQKAEIKVNAREEGEQFFSKFLYEVITPEDQDRLDEVWNGLYNAQSDINYKRVPVGFECSKTFKSGLLKISDAQREGVAFYEAMGSGICAYDVGVGKTMTAIIAVASAMANGRCQRPLIVVPKPTYKKWIAELIGYTDRETKEFVPGVLSFTGIEVNDLEQPGNGN
ncbi:MAG: SNF2-related protein [Bacteroidales bacterium]